MKREGQERGESKRRGERGRYYSAKQQRAGGSGEWGREDRRRGSRVEDRKRGAGQGLGGEGEQESAAQLCIAASRNRQHISTTSQEPVLFGGSIFENIAYGNRQSALPRQQHAARSTQHAARCYQARCSSRVDLSPSCNRNALNRPSVAGAAVAVSDPEAPPAELTLQEEADLEQRVEECGKKGEITWTIHRHDSRYHLGL